MKKFKQMSLMLVLAGLTGTMVAGPLHVAVQKGEYDEVQRLLTAGEDKDGRDKDGNTPLLSIGLRNPKRITNLLLDKGANINAEAKGQTPLIRAMYRYAGFNPEQLPDMEGKVLNLALKGAAAVGQRIRFLPYIKLLLKRKANPNLQPEGGYSPLSAAVVLDTPRLVDVLLKADADIHLIGNDEGLHNLVLALGIKGDNALKVTERLLREVGINDLIQSGFSSMTPLSWALHLRAKGYKNEGRIALIKQLGGKTNEQLLSQRRGRGKDARR